MLSKIWTGSLLFLAWMFFCAWLVLVCREKDVHPLRDFATFFKKQTKAGRIIFGSLFIALWVFASVKPGGGGGDGGGNGGGGTNNVPQMVMPPAGLSQMTLPGGTLQQQARVGIQHTGLQPLNSGTTPDLSEIDVITSTNTTRTITVADFARGFVQTRIGTDEQFDFTPPPNAAIVSDWWAFGAATDWIYANWGTGNGEWGMGTRLRIHSDGWAEARTARSASAPYQGDDGRAGAPRTPMFCPFRASLGIVPQANWNWLAGSDTPSQVWYAITPWNSLLLTWQNVLLDRDTDKPLSFQIEFKPDGQFIYRYDLSRLNVESVTNILVGASFGGNEWTTNSIPTNVTSLAFYPLSLEDATNQDRDGDGLNLIDELFVYGTNPMLPDSDFDGVLDGVEVSLGTNPAGRDSDNDGLVDGSDPDPTATTSLDDLDGDGIPDAYENHWFGGTNAFNTATDRDDTGFTLDTKILGGINPTNGVHAANIVSANSCVSWHLFDAFAIDLPAGATNLVWERTFAINRSSAWQQFFVSAAPTNAAAWHLHGALLEWEADTGTSGSTAASPCGDSFRIPLATNDLPSSITLRLRATGGTTVHSPSPLHLIAYSPEFRVDGGNEITGDSGAKFIVFTDGSDSQISLVIDHSLRPCNAIPGYDEGDMAEFENLSMTGGDFSFSGDASGGTIHANRPGIYTLPDYSLGVALSVPLRSPRRSGRRGSGGDTIIVLDPSVSWNCAGHGCGYDGLGYDWYGGWYYEEEYYPLDSKCLRKKWYRDWGGGWSHEYCELSVSSGLGDDGYVTTSTDDNRGTVYVDGVEVWSGSAEHTYDDYGCGDGYHEDYLGDECDSCDEDCANGNCDSLEGPSLGSLKFRIPLGAPVKGQVAGFVWFSSDGPVYISKSTFQLLEHPDAYITKTTQSGTRRIACHDSRGRDLRIENINDGARVTIYDTATQTLEHTWEIVNVNGSPSQVRLRKISRLNNVMSDETYTYADGDWTQFDNIAGVGTQLTTYNDFSDYGDGVKSETRTITDANGNVLSSVTTEQSRIGECENALLRETYRAESTGWGWKWSRADYWNDPAHSGRHGQPRLVWGNARAWVYADFDEFGHENLRIEQRGNSGIPSNFPYVISNVLYNVSGLADAFVTVRDFEPLSGDSRHTDDAARPRVETRYVVTNGVSTIIGRTWTRYTRLSRDGYAAIKKETWRAATQSSILHFTLYTLHSDIAYSYKITYADTGDGTPLLMRNAVAESLDENGILTVNSYSQSGGVLTQTSRKSYLSHPLPTYEVIERNASYGTVLRDTIRLTDGDTVIADEQSIYDSQNRLRSTTYLDGTSLTNAYSCCRLLWKRDREGRKTLRSAQTGTDHLYNALEDVWLAGVSTNGQYRVTQHFYDALGRETNTVTRIGFVPGEASAMSSSYPSQSSYTSRQTTSYPYGGSDYAVSTDERGRVSIRRIDILGNCIESGEVVFTNGVEVVKTKNRMFFGGGSSMRREWGGDKFTEERRFEDYAADGCRIEYIVTESHDCGVVTNSVSTYDFLGRLVSSAAPTGGTGVPPVQVGWSVTTYTYDGATSRILTSTYTAGDIVRTTTYLYNDRGEQVGTVLDGITNCTDVTYEQISNEWWKVETSSVISPSTNSLTIIRTQLTGLSDTYRRHTVTITGGATSPLPATVTDTLATRDPDTGIETETVTSSVAPTAVRRSLHGILLSTETGDSTEFNSYDALARVSAVSLRIGRDAPVASARSYEYAPSGDLLSVRTYTNNTDAVTESYAYDMLGNRTSTTDAHGNTVYRAYDPFARVTAEWGATYPVRYTYDTQGRRTSLSTTRDGATWDTTTWMYDHAAGNCLSKTYADGSTVTYTYTPDNLLLRTTYASGRWKENVYDATRQVVGVVSSDGAQDASMQRDEFGRVMAESNSVALAEYSLDDCWGATNETQTVDGVSVSFKREFDAYGRLARFARVGGEESMFGYAPHGAIFAVSNGNVAVEYAFTPDALDAGYALAVQGGLDFSREVFRHGYLRSCIVAVSNHCGNTSHGLEYSYDALQLPISRNEDTFGYNDRSEVVFSRRGAESAEDLYAYDGIGNLVSNSFGTITNIYFSNSRNQYTSNLCASAALRETTYDLDGNMTRHGEWTYAYDSGNRLVSVASNAITIATMSYDAQGRRVKKVAADGTHRYFYDGWLLVYEHIVRPNNTTNEIEYVWGKDVSGTRDGAAGIGGLLYQKRDGAIYVPWYDAYGNVLGYRDAQGNVGASYTYDAFGNIINQSGTMANTFSFRFSTKYFDVDCGLYYYGYRHYKPQLMCWLTEDPIGEEGGVNLYGFCKNNAGSNYDRDGRAYFAYRPLKTLRWIGVFGTRQDEIDNTVAGHENLFFEDGKQPDNLGYFEDGLHPDPDNRGYKPAHLRGFNDCIMRKAVRRLRPRPYDLLGGYGRVKYNCQDWAEEVRLMYYSIKNGTVFYPKSTTFIGGR